MVVSRALVLSFLIFSAPVFAQSQNALGDYALAQKCYHTLDKSGQKGWDRCVKRFQEIVSSYPNSEEATKALFSVGKLTQEKYEVSKDINDLQRAFDTYNTFLKTYSKHPLADDALFRIAVLRFEKQQDKERAEKAIKALLERYPNGDMASRAQDYLQKLGPPAVISVKPVEEEDLSVKPPPTEPVPAEVAPQSKLQPDFSIKMIVIDPGHGGEDPGAIGMKGTKEADVSLQIARKLAFKLKNDMKLKTFLTRTRNRTLSLEERNAFATQNKADLFISIHANANDSPKVGGIQTFYLNNATNEASKKLALRENKASKKPIDLSQKILSTMLQNANTEESRDLAHSVHQSLMNRLKKNYGSIKDLKVDSALFYVLVGSKSPSILLETSFVTNPEEEKRLKDSAYQWAIAEGVAKGIQHYIESRRKLASSL